MKGFRDKIVCVTVSTFFIFMFVDQLLLLDVIKYFLSCTTGTSLKPTKQQWWTSVIYCQNHDKSIFFYRFSPISIHLIKIT